MRKTIPVHGKNQRKPVFEMELVARKINKEKAEMARKGQKYLTEKEALAKYR